MTLVVGATGTLGGQVCRLLAQAGKPVRALVRDTADSAKVAELEGAGVEIAQGDLKIPESLKSACAGSESVISTASSTLSHQEGDTIETVDHQGQISLVNAAEEAGVKRFVFTSFRDDPANQYPLTKAKRAVEKVLQASDMNWTSIWAPPFMEAWLGPHLGFDYVQGKIRVYGTGEQKISWISVFDVAEFCVAVLDSSAARNRVLDTGGPEALSPLEVVAIFQELTGRSFEIEKIPQEALKQQKASATNPMEETFAGLMLQCAGNWEVDMSQVLTDFPAQLTGVRDYAHKVLEV